MVLIAFDVDGTLDCSQGPVSVERLRYLSTEGIRIVIVSPSRNRPQGFEESIQGNRFENLKAIPNQEGLLFKLYISDNHGDDEVAKAAGFSFCHPWDFR